MSTFQIEAFQNQFLPPGGTEVNAIVTVSATGGDGAAAAGRTDRAVEAAEIVIIDTSGSMDYPRAKIKAAKEATQVAIDCIRDGVAFGVIAGSDTARPLYPPDGSLAIASPATREQAVLATSRVQARGGTAIGTWLTLAREMFQRAAGARICHAILLTDGENEHESDADLDAAIDGCRGVFQCDCRGVGTDWVVSELRRVATGLLGTVDIVAEPEALADDFRSMIETAMGKATADVSLRIWTPQGAELAFVRQVAPEIAELTDQGTSSGPLASDYPTGAWGEESRDYHVCVHVPARELGDEMLAARVSLVEGDEVLGQALVKAQWTDDEELSTKINREVAHYTGQAELADAIQEGLEARKAGDEGTATFKLGRAAQLAAESGNEGTMRLLRAVVEVEDAASGTVRLRRDVSDADEMTLDTRSTKTVRLGGGGA
jgi:hypothetical protein